MDQIVKPSDAVGNASRANVDYAFDQALGSASIQAMSRATLCELASLDGAVVVSNTGRLLAYGAVLDPKIKGKIHGSEGSRTKAAIGSSHYGLAVKISSDGDITVYLDGKKLIAV